MIARLWERLRRDGLRETARAGLGRLRKEVYLHEEHVWYQCDLDDGRQRGDLPDGLRLVRAEPKEADAVAQLGQLSSIARSRLENGNDLWLVLRPDGEPLFACYTFRHTAPVLAAPHGALSLPVGAACLEDSVTSPAARGLGVAPGAWTLICDELEHTGFTALLTKVATGNTASRRAVEKVGFRPVAVMEHLRVVRAHRRTTVRVLGDGLGKDLADRLT